MQQDFNAVFERDGEWWVATAVEIPGAFSQGKTLEEARENLLDAVRELILAQRELAERELVNKDVYRETLSLTLE
jgi:predicted RNase H-like HicB family nuclease